MTLYQSIIYPIFARLDAEWSHHLTLAMLRRAQSNSLGKQILSRIAGDLYSQPVEIAGLTFPNVLGVAAGFDKDVIVASGLAQLGFGHVEVGTLTPKPQEGNPKPRVFRLPSDHALINRMGFPNCGVLEALPRLKELQLKPRSFVLGVSLGKQKDTPLAEAADDYLFVMQKVYLYADYLAVNISSPNTPGLRELQGSGYLGNLLGILVGENIRLSRQTGVPQRPLFLKISPDISSEDLDDILFAALANHIDGLIATNTTISRDGLQHKNKNQTGGLSGRPLKKRSADWIREIHTRTEGRLPIIGVGGIDDFESMQSMLAAGASAVQIYTGLVYQGPGLPGRLLRAQAQANNWRKKI